MKGMSQVVAGSKIESLGILILFKSSKENEYT